MKTVSALRILAALALLVAGLVHLQLYFAGYRSYPNPNLGRSFLVNALASGVLSVALLAHGGRLVRLLAMLLAAASLAAFVLSRTSDRLFGFREQGLSPSPQASLAITAELAVLVLLGASFLLRDRDRPPTATVPIVAATLAVAVAMSGFAAVWANTYGSRTRSARPVAADTTVAPDVGASDPTSPAPTRTSTVPASTQTTAAGPTQTAAASTQTTVIAPTQTTAPPDPVTTLAPSTSAATPDAAVDIAEFAFVPESITVGVGTTVTWINLDAFDHSVVAADTAPESFDSGTLEPNDDFTQTFAAAGEYAYICGIHPYMRGTVVVTPSA